MSHTREQMEWMNDPRRRAEALEIQQILLYEVTRPVSRSSVAALEHEEKKNVIAQAAAIPKDRPDEKEKATSAHRPPTVVKIPTIAQLHQYYLLGEVTPLSDDCKDLIVQYAEDVCLSRLKAYIQQLAKLKKLNLASSNLIETMAIFSILNNDEQLLSAIIDSGYKIDYEKAFIYPFDRRFSLYLPFYSLPVFAIILNRINMINILQRVVNLNPDELSQLAHWAGSYDRPELIVTLYKLTQQLNYQSITRDAAYSGHLADIFDDIPPLKNYLTKEILLNSLQPWHSDEQFEKRKRTVKLIAQHIDIHTKDEKGSTLLHQLATYPSWVHSMGSTYHQIKLLAECKADLNLENKEGNTPLLLAATTAHTEALHALAEEKVDLNQKLCEPITHLVIKKIQASKDEGHARYHLQAVEVLAMHGVRFDQAALDLASKGSYGDSIFERLTYVAVELGNLELLEDLLKAKNDPHYFLDFACKLAQPTALKWLLSNKELKLQASSQQFEMTIRPLIHPIRMESEGRRRYPAIRFLKLSGGNVDQTIKTLVEFKADVDAYNEEGDTPLTYAVCSRNLMAVKSLIACHANLNLGSKDNGETPAHHAVRHLDEMFEDTEDLFLGSDKSPNLAIIKELSCYTPINFNQVNNEGESPLQLAVDRKQWQMVVFMLSTLTHSYHIKDDVLKKIEVHIKELTNAANQVINSMPMNEIIQFIEKMNSPNVLMQLLTKHQLALTLSDSTPSDSRECKMR